MAAKEIKDERARKNCEGSNLEKDFFCVVWLILKVLEQATLILLWRMWEEVAKAVNMSGNSFVAEKKTDSI